ncbi:MAG: hypothetical protein ACR2F1_10490 [Nitrososphaeraceae archaeon]
MWHHSNKGNKSIKFTDNTIECCVSFIKFENSANIIPMATNSYHIRKYYSTIINSLILIIKNNNGKVVKSMGNGVLRYFLTSVDKNEEACKDVTEYPLHQQIKSIVSAIKILFVTALDIVNKLLSIFYGIFQNQIIKKSVNKKIFVDTV